jgi:branched-subunit amino acid transport protein
MTTWIAILATAAGCYLLKLLGLLAPEGLLERPLVRRFAALAPVALLAALTALQTWSQARTLTIDARTAGLTAAALALLARAPFLLVIIAAVATTALVRALG